MIRGTGKISDQPITSGIFQSDLMALLDGGRQVVEVKQEKVGCATSQNTPHEKVPSLLRYPHHFWPHITNHSTKMESDRLRGQLQSTLEKLQNTLRYWQTWEAEYEGFKEELELLDNEPSQDDMVFALGFFWFSMLTALRLT
jgi:hypothetical protein